MTKEESKILNEFLSKTLKIDAEQLATLYNEAGELQGLQIAFDADASRVSKIKTENQNQYNRGLKEGASKIEKEIKSKYELDSELIGVELVDQIVLSKVEEATKGVTKDISKHPEMLKARTEWEKEQKARDKEWQTKLEAKEKEFERSKLLDKVKSKGLVLLEELKPILPQDPIKASAWRQTFVNDLLSSNFAEAEDDFLILDKDGNPQRDAHGYGRNFKEYVKEISDKYFDYQKSEDRSSAGNKDSAGSKAGLPKSEEEAYNELKNPNITPERRIEITNFLKEKK